MLIRVEDIKEKGLFLDYQEDLETFPGLLEMGESGSLAILDPLQVRLRAIRVRDLVEVEGTVGTRLRVSCSRCLKEFESPLSVPFTLTFSRSPVEIEEETEGEEIELTAEDMGLIPFHGDEIALNELIEEQVVLGLPLRPLCNEDCRGLCAYCGKDLNEGPCDCTPGGFFGKFDKLKELKVDRKNSGKG